MARHGVPRHNTARHIISAQHGGRAPCTADTEHVKCALRWLKGVYGHVKAHGMPHIFAAVCRHPTSTRCADAGCPGLLIFLTVQLGMSCLARELPHDPPCVEDHTPSYP